MVFVAHAHPLPPPSISSDPLRESAREPRVPQIEDGHLRVYVWLSVAELIIDSPALPNGCLYSLLQVIEPGTGHSAGLSQY